MEKEGRRDWVQSTVQSCLYPQRPTPHPQFLAGAQNFPPHLSGVPPDPRAPTPPANAMRSICVCQSEAELGALREVLPQGAKPRSASATVVASAALLARGCDARLGAWGRPATPPTAHPLGRVTLPPLGRRSVAVCRQMRGVKAPRIKQGSTTQPGRVAALPGTRQQQASARNRAALSTPALRRCAGILRA